MERALSEGPVLITQERDFGELVYARGERGHGVQAAKNILQLRQTRISLPQPGGRR